MNTSGRTLHLRLPHKKPEVRVPGPEDEIKESEFPAQIVLLHLSDIHFRKDRAGDPHDPDADLRNELERDLRTIRTTLVQRVDGIIVSGDIAFGGQPEEFEFAEGWLERLRELIDCPKDSIMVSPGNHDVDRSVIPQGGEIDLLHEEIRSAADLQTRDERIAAILRDGEKGEKMFKPMEAYNAFAQKYGCSVTAARPYWERDFQLARSVVLRIRGMTSTLVSSPRDNEQTHKLVYGAAQRTLLRIDDVFRMVVGHHPPSWTMEGDEADRIFGERSVIQLFGHKHESWFRRIGCGIRVIAGAVHPDRAEHHWEPRYSLIALRLDDDGRLHIRVYPRVWKREEMIFMADINSKYHDYRDHTVERERN
jgi:hypothetical protein